MWSEPVKILTQMLHQAQFSFMVLGYELYLRFTVYERPIIVFLLSDLVRLLAAQT